MLQLIIALVSIVLFFLLLGYLLFDWYQERRWAKHQLVIAALKDAITLNRTALDRVKDSSVQISAGTEMDDTESLIAISRRHPLPEIRGIGLVMEKALKTITGEEKEQLGSKEFFNGMVTSLDLIRYGLERTNSINDIYNGLTKFVSISISRGRGFDKSKTTSNKKAYIKTLKDSIESLRQNRPGQAKVPMAKWQDNWKHPGRKTALPENFMPIALAASEAIMDIYGEQLVYEGKYSEKRNRTIQKLLENTQDVISREDIDPKEAVGILTAWERSEPRRPSS